MSPPSSRRNAVSSLESWTLPRRSAGRSQPSANLWSGHGTKGARSRGWAAGARPWRAAACAKRGSNGQMQISAELVPIPDASGCVRMRRDAYRMRRDASRMRPGCVGMRRDFEFLESKENHEKPFHRSTIRPIRHDGAARKPRKGKETALRLPARIRSKFRNFC